MRRFVVFMKTLSYICFPTLKLRMNNFLMIFLQSGSFFTPGNIIWIVYGVIILITIGMIIHDRRDPVKALAWIMFITVVVGVGIVSYILFGRNHRKRKIFNSKEIRDAEKIEEMCCQQLKDVANPDIKAVESIESHRDMITLLLNNSKSLLSLNNKVKILLDGKQKFDELFEAIGNATSHIHLEYYIFMHDDIGKRLISTLEEKAREGVEVRVIYDDVGSWGLKYRHVRHMRAAGIEVRGFMPVKFPWFTNKANYRNHRKIAIIDGRVGFTGGINIADRYINGVKWGPWRDTHLRIDGQAVAMMQALFIADWYFVNKKELLDVNSPKYFPKTKLRTVSPVQIVSSGPDSDWAAIMQAYFAAFNKAEKSIYISTPYFTPTQAILTSLKVASLSGVDVRIMLPSHSDSKIAYWASRSYISELLDAGIKIYLYRNGFSHSKFIVIDDEFCSVGSANMDYRSFEDNFEITAILYDPAIAVKLSGIFMDDLKCSLLLSKSEWEKRSQLHAAYEAFSRLLSPLL